MTSARERKKREWRNNSLRIGTWNTRAWNNKAQEIIIELSEKHIDICAVSETKKKGKGIVTYQDYIMFYSGVPKETRAKEGVGILLNKKYENSIDDYKFISERILMVSLRMTNMNTLYIFSIYAPEDCKPEREKESFYDTLHEYLNLVPPDKPVLILGDFNARIGNNIVPGIKQRFNEATLNDNGMLLTQFCSDNALRINNTFFEHKMQSKMTWRNTRGSESVIDYIVSNRSIHPSQILDVRSLNSADIGSDHSLVLCKLRLGLQKVGMRDGTVEERINYDLLEDESTRDLYQRRLENQTDLYPLTEERSVEENWETLKTNILRAAREALGTRKIQVPPKPRRHTPWFSKEIATLAQTKSNAFLQFKSKKTQEAYLLYKEVRNSVNFQIREIKRSYWEGYTKGLERDFYGQQRKVWGMIRNQKKESLEYIPINRISKEGWVKHFTLLYAGDPEELIFKKEETSVKLEVEWNEVISAIKKLRNRKSPGEDGITNELIKYEGPNARNATIILIRQIFQNCVIPSEWKTNTIIPIFKKGEKKNPENYRGINLLNTHLKLTTSIISDNILKMIQLQDEQQGFRRGRSCVDAIFIIRQISEKSLEFNRPAFFCFIDLEKAFDRIRLKHVLNILEKYNVPDSLICLIQNIYVDNYAKVKIDGKIEGMIPVQQGIRQGDSLSPLLFNIVMNEIIKDVRGMRGYSMGDNDVNIVCYADDVALVAEDEDSLQRLLYRFSLACTKFDLKISTKKTKSLTISKEPLRCKLQLYDQIIEQVLSFTYLGIQITSYQDLSDEVRHQTIKASRISGYLNDTVWSNKYLKTEPKVRIYKSVVRPVLTYAAETRSDTKKTARMLEVTEMKTLRRIAAKTMRDGVTNREIRERCGVQNITEWVSRRRREWNDHISRMSEDRLVRRVRDNRPVGWRSRGRPKKRWHDALAITGL